MKALVIGENSTTSIHATSNYHIRIRKKSTTFIEFIIDAKQKFQYVGLVFKCRIQKVGLFQSRIICKRTMFISMKNKFQNIY